MTQRQVASDGSGRLFIVLQGGAIVIHDGTRILPTPFLDLSAILSCCGEQGLLGLAFHPDYAGHGRFYVNYTNRSADTVIAGPATSNDRDPGAIRLRRIDGAADRPKAPIRGGFLCF